MNISKSQRLFNGAVVLFYALFGQAAQARELESGTTAGQPPPNILNKTVWMLEFVPPLQGYSVTIAPLITLSQDASKVSGRSNFRLGWCGNEELTASTLDGTWVGNELDLLWLHSPVENKTVRLQAAYDNKAGYWRGHSTVAGASYRPFVLVPAARH